LLTTNPCSWPELSVYNPPALQVPAGAHDTDNTWGVPSLVEGGGTGDLLRFAPGAVHLVDHEHLPVAGGVLCGR
jgi:hypothetical protein